MQRISGGFPPRTPPSRRAARLPTNQGDPSRLGDRLARLPPERRPAAGAGRGEADGAIIQSVEPFKPLWPKLLVLVAALALVSLFVVPVILSRSRTPAVHRACSDPRAIVG